MKRKICLTLNILPVLKCSLSSAVTYSNLQWPTPPQAHSWNLLESPTLCVLEEKLPSPHWLAAISASSWTVQTAISCCCRWVWLVPVITPDGKQITGRKTNPRSLKQSSFALHQNISFQLFIFSVYYFWPLFLEEKKLPRGWERTDSCGFCGFCDTCGNPASWPNKEDYKYEIKRYIPVVGAQPVLDICPCGFNYMFYISSTLAHLSFNPNQFGFTLFM